MEKINFDQLDYDFAKTFIKGNLVCKRVMFSFSLSQWILCAILIIFTWQKKHICAYDPKHIYSLLSIIMPTT